MIHGDEWLVAGVLLVGGLVLLFVVIAVIEVLGASVGLWHAPCALMHHQPQCKGWR